MQMGKLQQSSNSLASEVKPGVWREAYIALGSNLGDREGLLGQALKELHAHPQIEVLQVSKLYETDPVGYADQPQFLNMAAAVRTSLGPLPLLRQLLAIERGLGRVREIPNGPRTIDLDLLHYEGTAMSTEELELPHPRMMERAFVLIPLLDLLPGSQAEFPLRAAAIDRGAAFAREGKDGITAWNTANWLSVYGHFEN